MLSKLHKIQLGGRTNARRKNTVQMISTGRETRLKRQIKSPLFIYTLRRPKACNERIFEQVP